MALQVQKSVLLSSVRYPLNAPVFSLRMLNQLNVLPIQYYNDDDNMMMTMTMMMMMTMTMTMTIGMWGVNSESERGQKL